jgi:hypothetical protein
MGSNLRWLIEVLLGEEMRIAMAGVVCSMVVAVEICFLEIAKERKIKRGKEYINSTFSANEAAELKT